MKAQLYQFQIDTFKPGFSVIIKTIAQDAKRDTLTIALKEFGSIARILGEGRKVKSIPQNATPVKNAVANGKQWAWIVYEQKEPNQCQPKP